MNFDVGDLGNLFGSFFSGQHQAGQPQGPVTGSDLQYTIDLSFEDVLNGLNTRLMVQHEVACSQCKGKKVEPGHDMEDGERHINLSAEEADDGIGSHRRRAPEHR